MDIVGENTCPIGSVCQRNAHRENAVDDIEDFVAVNGVTFCDPITYASSTNKDADIGVTGDPSPSQDVASNEVTVPLDEDEPVGVRMTSAIKCSVFNCEALKHIIVASDVNTCWHQFWRSDDGSVRTAPRVDN